MDKVTQVANFVEEIFDLYHLNKYGFFIDSDEDTWEYYDIPLFPNGEIDDDTLSRVSIKLGLTPDEILSLDEDVKYKYWDMFPFFQLYDSFLETWAWNSRYKEKVITEEAFLKAVFTEDTSGLLASERYDYPAVAKRMVEQLKEMDEYLPGTFHPNAKITNLEIDTEVLFSFPEITEMIRLYLAMVEQVKWSFFKALKTPLTAEEAHEYNFLVNALHITDSIMPSVFLTYDNVCTYKQAYIEEGFDDFLAYAKVKSFVGAGMLHPGVNPWRCKEFFDDIELVQELMYIFPEMKELMRRFAITVKNFHCRFVWSDANPITFSEEEEEEDKLLGCYVPLEERAKESTTIYVSKTKAELYDWDSYIDKINTAIAPPSQGGLKSNPLNVYTLPPYSIDRLRRRFELRKGGNV